uniref:Uncharacterized protein n=1 Tax=Avena sativa TaxID=4498 RepID=A0ACD6AI49_AVESA
MAFFKHLLAVVLVLVVVVAQATDDSSSVMGGGQRSLLGETKIDCTSACQTRCGRNWKNSMCNKLCNMCCGKCNCVPPGTGQDTRSQCPCYANMVNSKNGKPKCP